MEYKPNIDTILERLCAFWNRDLIDHPPIRISFPIASETGEIWDFAIQSDEEHYAYWDRIFRERSMLDDDEIPTATLDLGPGLMPAILGAEILFSHGTSWGGHLLEDWSDYCKLAQNIGPSESKWFSILKQRSEAFEKSAKGKCAVGVAMLTGPGDIAAALRGVTNICFDFALNEEKLNQLLTLCTNAFMTVSQEQMNWIKDLNGGYCDNYGIWTPGRSGYFADDVTSLLSPEMYRKFLFSYDCRIAGSFEIPWLHVHSCQARLIPEFVQIPKLRGIQIVNDSPAGPDLQQIFPFIQQVQENYCLILRKYTIDELAPFFSKLNLKGLYIDTQCSNLEEAQNLLGNWKKGVPWKRA